MIKIRRAEKEEIEWINARYDEVEFVHSRFDAEIIAIAELDGKKAGLGRLVTIDDQHCELGGMFVFENFRGLGIAKKIVEFLLNSAQISHIYCIPFAHLISFYGEFGFLRCTDIEGVPSEISKKLEWCQDKYSHPTELLVLKTHS